MILRKWKTLKMYFDVHFVRKGVTQMFDYEERQHIHITVELLKTKVMVQKHSLTVAVIQTNISPVIHPSCIILCCLCFTEAVIRDWLWLTA